MKYLVTALSFGAILMTFSLPASALSVGRLDKASTNFKFQHVQLRGPTGSTAGYRCHRVCVRWAPAVPGTMAGKCIRYRNKCGVFAPSEVIR